MSDEGTTLLGGHGMETKIPEELKAAVPLTLWGKVLAATPVIMAVVATLLAALASSEMTKAQYDRSMAAQLQSKAGDQWGYFQAKKLRGTGLKTAGDMLQVTAEVGRLDAATLKSSIAGLAQGLARCDDGARRLRDALNAAGATGEAMKAPLDAFVKGEPERTAEAGRLAADLSGALSGEGATSALAVLCGGDLPAVGAGPKMDAALSAALDGLQSGKTEAEMEELLAPVSDQTLADALQAAWDRVRALGTQLEPINDLSDRLNDLLDRQLALAQAPLALRQFVDAMPAGADAGLRQAGDALASACQDAHAAALQLLRDFTAARFAYASRRYDAEASLNQNIANLYELQVRKNNISADRHHDRSQRFFYGMLAAQMAVIIATLAMAARQRNLLWSLAAGAGLVAVSFGVYVYLVV